MKLLPIKPIQEPALSSSDCSPSGVPIPSRSYAPRGLLIYSETKNWRFLTVESQRLSPDEIGPPFQAVALFPSGFVPSQSWRKLHFFDAPRQPEK